MKSGLVERSEAMHVDDIVFTVNDVATRLKIHPSVIRKLIYAGKLTAFYVGGRRIRITERHLEVFLQSEARVT